MKDRFTDGLEIKLLKYSLAAGAILLGAKAADAQVWYSGTVNSTIVGPSSIPIPLNRNTRFTISENVVTSFITTFTTPGGFPGSSSTVQLQPLNQGVNRELQMDACGRHKQDRGTSVRLSSRQPAFS